MAVCSAIRYFDTTIKQRMTEPSAELGSAIRYFDTTIKRVTGSVHECRVQLYVILIRLSNTANTASVY